MWSFMCQNVFYIFAHVHMCLHVPGKLCEYMCHLCSMCFNMCQPYMKTYLMYYLPVMGGHYLIILVFSSSFSIGGHIEGSISQV